LATRLEKRTTVKKGLTTQRDKQKGKEIANAIHNF